MLVDFHQLPASSRLWVYQSNRPFKTDEEEILKREVAAFCGKWATHNNAMRTSFSIEHHHFLLLAVDGTHQEASGCSIDDSVHLVQQLGQKLDINFLDRAKIAFLEKGVVILVPLTDLKNRFANGTLQPNQLTFSIQLTTKGDWEERGLVPASRSWVSRYLPETTVA